MGSIKIGELGPSPVTFQSSTRHMNQHHVFSPAGHYSDELQTQKLHSHALPAQTPFSLALTIFQTTTTDITREEFLHSTPLCHDDSDALFHLTQRKQNKKHQPSAVSGECRAGEDSLFLGLIKGIVGNAERGRMSTV